MRVRYSVSIVSSIADAFVRFPHLGMVLPALGYGETQLAELGQSINAAPCNVVMLGTPALLEALVKIDRPTVRVGFEARDVAGSSLAEVVLAKLGGTRPV